MDSPTLRACTSFFRRNNSLCLSLSTLLFLLFAGKWICQPSGLADEAGKPSPSGSVVSQETSAEIAKEKGNQAFKDKSWQRAIGFYTDAIKLNSNSATYYSNRAAAYLELGSLLQAEADCTKAIELDKKNLKAYLTRGTAREMLSYYKEAIEDFRYALALEPTNKRASLSADRLKKLFQ